MRNCGTESCVEFIRSCLLRDYIHICTGDAGAGNDDDAPARLLNELGESRSTVDCIDRPAGSQNPSRASLDHVFERPAQISRNVESTMKRHGQWPRLFDQLLCAFDVYTPIAAK